MVFIASHIPFNVNKTRITGFLKDSFFRLTFFLNNWVEFYSEGKHEETCEAIQWSV